MKRLPLLVGIIIVVLLAGGAYWYFTQTASAEPWLVAVTYTGHSGADAEDGVALIDLNPDSDSFGDLVDTSAIGKGVMPHHLYYSPDGKQLYTTALGGDTFYTINIKDERISNIAGVDAGTCQLGENLYFDGADIYLSCMGSNELVVFNRDDLSIKQSLKADMADNAEAYIRYPHGFGVSKKLDRIIVSETISADLSDPGTKVTVMEYSTGKVLSTHTLAKTEGAPSAPVEIVFLPNEEVAYITGMLDASLWKASWNASTGEFEFAQIDDPASRGHTWPLEMYMMPNDLMYVSYAQPGAVDVYNIQDPQQPKYLRTLPAGAGAHHILFSDDGKYMFVQNNLLGLDAMNAGTISVVDLDSGELVSTVNSFNDANMLPTSMAWLK